MFLHGHNINIYASRWRNLSQTGALYCICTGTSWEGWWVGPNCALCTAPALAPLERDGGPNCAAGLVLVLSVDTVPQLDTGHYNRVQAGTALATAWRASTVVSGIWYCGVGAGRGTRVEGKCDLQSGLTPTMAPHTMCQPYGSPCHTDDNSNKGSPQSKQLKICWANQLCWSLIP